MNLSKFRRIQVILSSIVFMLVFVYFFFTSPKSITEIQLSFWGANGTHSWIWNTSLALLSITMFINVYYYIISIPKLLNKELILLLFSTISLSLFLTALINVGIYSQLHNMFAFYYFFSCPFAIFLLAYTNYKNLTYKEWRTHIIYSILILIIPLSIVKLFNGMAISESIHSSIIILWNYWLLKKHL